MIYNKIQEMLRKSGYSEMRSEIQGVSVFCRKEEDKIIQILMMLRPESRYSRDQMYQIADKCAARFYLQGIRQVDSMCLLVTSDAEGEGKPQAGEHTEWMIDEANRRLLIYENQPAAFHGIEDMVYQVLNERPKPVWQRISIVNALLVTVNVVIFIILYLQNPSLDALFMFQHGALTADAVMQGGEIYRILTCMFLHFSFSHLMNNMIMLYAIGERLEKIIGTWKYIAVYFISGLAGSLLTLWNELRTGDMAVSAGASGAVYGIIGALLVVVIKNKGRIEHLTSRRIAILLAGSLYYGFVGTNIGNAAHVGGTVAGALFALLFVRSAVPAEKRA